MKHIIISALLAAAISTSTATARNDNAPDLRLDGEWIVYNVRGNSITGEERPYMTFNLATSRIYGNNGCNVFNGSMVSDGKGAIRFEDMLSTQMLCGESPVPELISNALPLVKGYTISRYGHELYLDLKNEKGQTLIVLRRHNMDFLNGAWRITRIGDKENHNESLEIVIDIPEMRLHGNTGGNIVNGSLFIDPDKKNSIQFIHLVSTRMACMDPETETNFLVALEEVESAYSINDNEVKMCDPKGRTVLTMHRIDPRKEN